MHHILSSLAKATGATRLSSLAIYLLKDEAIGGRLILAAVALALLVVNSPLSQYYESFWHTTLSIGLGQWALSLDLRHWVNDGLMTLFFLVVGLELKRELVAGELRDRRTALLPMCAAVGGMAVPALLYFAVNTTDPSTSGWAIPMATDIAIAVGVLALAGKGLPSSIRLFLLTLAIVDDIAAVIVIALFYSSNINAFMLLGAVALSLVSIILLRRQMLSLGLFVAMSSALWILVNASGVHPGITGALIGMLAPLSVPRPHKKSIAERLERFAIPVSTFIAVPLFAFANAGVVLSFDSLQGESTSTVALGIILGLVVGKVAGIFGATWLLVRLGVSRLPSGSSWRHILGVGALAGIGFTVSIFVTELAFTDQQLVSAAKISIFVASLLSGLLGLGILRRAGRVTQ